jgi:CRISPR/Cas system CMR subunit Cmr4 (Cas7 group RAMP superfamily)
MSSTQIALMSASVAIALIVALWGITATYTNRLVEQFKLYASQSEQNTTRLIEQFDKRMRERDEKLLASEQSTTRLMEQFDKRMDERDEKLLASEQSTMRLIEQLEKRMNERDEKLLAKLDAVEARLAGQIEALRIETRSERESVRGEIERLSFRVERLERRAA